MFMIKTIRERQAQDPPKETRFVLRGRVVDPKDIARFEKRAQKKGLIKEGEPIEVQGEPPEKKRLVCCLDGDRFANGKIAVCRTSGRPGVRHTTS